MKKHFHMHIGSSAGILKRLGKDPYADWLVILISSLVLSVIFICFGVYLFLYINNTPDSATAAGVPATGGNNLDRADLARIIADFQNKEQRTVSFESGYSEAPDPSVGVSSAATGQATSTHKSVVKSTF